MEEEIGTRDLLLETLTKIGCQYEEDEDGETIYFAFQGENFLVEATNDDEFIYVYDIKWEQMELYDVDDFSRLKRTINEANIHKNRVTTVYTIDEAGSNVYVHCKAVFLFIPQIPEIDVYLRAMLTCFFDAHQFIYIEMEKLRDRENAEG